MADKIETIFFSQKLKMEEAEYTVGVGEKRRLHPVIEPKEASSRPVYWKTDRDEIVAVDPNGILEGISVGDAMVYAKCDYGADRCKVHVVRGEQEIYVDDCYDLLVDIKTFQMNIGQKGDGKLTFQSDHEEIVSVSDRGCLHLCGTGKANITIRASETGQYLACTCTVPVCVMESGLPAFCISEIRNRAEGILVQWKEAAGADGYYIYRESENGARKKIYTISGPQNTAFTDIDVEDGKNYRYILKAYSSGRLSPEVRAKNLICRLSMVNLERVAEKKGHILLVWTPIPGVQGYLVYRKNATDGWNVLSRVLGAESSEYQDSEVILDENYTYSVAAFKGDQLGVLDITGKEIVYTGIPELDKVCHVRISGRARDALRIKWEKQEEARGYVIQQKKEGKWVRIARITNADTLTYRVENLSPGEKYDFRIRAFAFYEKKQYNSKFVKISGRTLEK